MRGTPRGAIVPRQRDRIIPAHAGNTSIRIAWKSATEDHPRTCGEHPVHGHHASGFAGRGSSPHMRGTRVFDCDIVAVPGIIPAHAGNTGSSMMAATQRGDHPRTCGEHRKSGNRPRIRRGSSPHMRGTPVAKIAISPPPRIIPAHAGNTLRFSISRLSGRDHPRTCGEHLQAGVDSGAYQGSSPHMRGTLHHRRTWAG